MNKTQSKAKKVSLLNLQKEYLENTMAKIDQMIQLSENLSTVDDPTILEVYLEQIKKAEEEADESYRIACEIENAMK
jgi:hypothetical protein